VVKLRRKVAAFLVAFFAVAQRSLRSAQRATRRVSAANQKVTGMSGHPDDLKESIKIQNVRILSNIA
jgi:hypothetical protein